MATATCPHGLASGSCLICKTLALSPERPPVEVLTSRPARRRGALGPRLLGLAVLAIGVVLLVGWIAALIWAALRVVEIVAVAVVSGWVFWHLGVRHGRRHPR